MALRARVAAHLYHRYGIIRCPELPLLRRLAAQAAVHPCVRTDLVRKLLREGDHLVFEGAGLRIQSPAVVHSVAEIQAEGFAQVVLEALVAQGIFWRHVRPRPGGVALDVGANIGTTAISLSRAVGPTGRVYAFEPLYHETTAVNVSANGASNVVVVPEAVGDRTGTCRMCVTPFGADSRLAPEGSIQVPVAVEERQIPITTLDEWVARAGLPCVDFVKMDIEGAEELALRGAKSIMARYRPMWSIASYHRDLSGVPQHDRLTALLRGLGYSVKEVGKDHIYAW